MIWKITTAKTTTTATEKETETETRKHKWVDVDTTPNIPPSPNSSPSPGLDPQYSFVHIPHTKAKKGLIGISRRVSKSLFCFAVFFGPTPPRDWDRHTDRKTDIGKCFSFLDWLQERVRTGTSMSMGMSMSTSTSTHSTSRLCASVSVSVCSAFGLVGVYLNMFSQSFRSFSAWSWSLPKIHLYLEIPFWWTQRFRVCLHFFDADSFSLLLEIPLFLLA